LRPARGIDIGADQTKIVALIGATGVGKTTTIAKIAANFVLDKACSVALITADTYRISAVEQLKTYSDIIGVPLEIVYSPDELRLAIDKHRDKQLILIDTAGRSQHNEFQLEELKCLLAVVPDIEKHLVLSATTKYKDAVDILRKFSLCEPDKVLFTKVDETSTVGAIINLVHQYPITLSYITNGQSVPDDIVVADSKELAKLLLR
jgi:flagellar biosynthesis protein FlhF